MHLDGVPLSSRSRGDFTACLSARPGHHQITLAGIDRPLWLRVLQFELPFTRSRVLAKVALDGAVALATVAFEVGSATTATAAPSAESR